MRIEAGTDKRGVDATRRRRRWQAEAPACVRVTSSRHRSSCRVAPASSPLPSPSSPSSPPFSPHLATASSPRRRRRDETMTGGDYGGGAATTRKTRRRRGAMTRQLRRLADNEVRPSSGRRVAPVRHGAPTFGASVPPSSPKSSSPPLPLKPERAFRRFALAGF